MAVVGMTGVSFVGPWEEIERVALSLLGMENFEPMAPEVMMNKHPMSSRFHTFRGNRYDALLEKLDKLWTDAGLPIPLRASVVDRVPAAPLSELEAGVDKIMQVREEWNTNVDDLRMQYEGWRAILEFGEVLRETGRNFADLPNALYGRMSIGTLTRENWRRLSETSQAAPILALPLVDIAEENTVTAVVFYSNDYRGEIEKIFASVHIRLVTIRQEEYSLYDAPDAVRYRMESIEAEMETYQNMPSRFLAENRFNLEKLYAAVYTMQRVYSLCQLRGELSGMTVLAGWVPEDASETVAAMLADKAPHTLMMEEKGDVLEEEGNELPTLLRNLPLVRRFQEIVRLYSLPSYNELDPTFVVAASFCLFFGFMFGDIGHGLLLVGGTWLLEKKGIMGSAIASVMKIAGGIAILFGFLYGSVFGNEEIIHPIWLSPMKDVDRILPISIGVGIAFLTLGISFKIYNCLRKKEFGEAILSPEGLTGLVFYWLAIAYAFGMGTSFIPALMLGLFVVMIFGNGISKYLFHGETVDEGGVTHVFSIFHVMLNFISNTASFVRLAAFALNHAGLSGAVFMLGDMVANVPGGILYNAFILVLGHLVIVGLEGLIVFIQTLRLEYYEFFGKFYHGGGREFMPVLWKRQSRIL